MATGATSRAMALERAIYARVVEELGHVEPSSLLTELAAGRTRGYAPRELLAAWRDAPSKASPDAALNIYVHVPFCKSICSFCNYKRLRVSTRESLVEFAGFIENEARLFAPAFEGLEVDALYVGGGTPSVLGAGELERVLSALHASFRFRTGAHKTFEFDPMVMTEDRHRVVRGFGFTHYSFGIQSVDVEVNQLHQRGPQSREHITRQFELLGREGAIDANVDLLLGLAGTTPEQMLAELEEIVTTHRPTGVSIYFVQPTHEYVASHFDGDLASFRAFIRPFEERAPPGVRAIAARTGYVVVADGRHALRLNRANSLPPSGAAESRHYCDVPSLAHRPLFVLGFGDSARSRIFGRLAYRAEHDHVERSADSVRYLGAPMTAADEMFGYLALVLRDGDEVSRPLFRRTFGVDVIEVAQKPLEKLIALGVATVTPECLRFSPQGRLERLRDVLFFLPRERRTELDVSVRRATRHSNGTSSGL